MPLYEYKCKDCGETWTEFRGMGSASDESHQGEMYAAQPLCRYGKNNQHAGKRVYSPSTIPNFTEDRLRLWRGVNGTRYSHALGSEMPQTRAELNALAERKGIEFVSPSSMPDDWKDCVDYRKHVDSGGERIENPESFYDVSGFNATDTRPDYMKERT